MEVLSTQQEELIKKDLIELLKGGFAPNVILFREFSFDKAGVILDGLHFSAWILLGHIRARQQVLYKFMKQPEKEMDLWPDAHWPENHQPETSQEWHNEIYQYEKELQEVLELVQNTDHPLLQKNAEGNSVFEAALILLHHTGYHVGQLKTVGRQLGVW